MEISYQRLLVQTLLFEYSSYDASLRVRIAGEERKFLIGIKTFGISSGMQKVAQMKSESSQWATFFDRINHVASGLDSVKEINRACAEDIQ